jgi:hypothetical protein
MIFITILSFFILGIAIGGNLQTRLTKRAIRLEHEKMTESKKSQFIELINCLKTGNTKFKSRVNDTVYVATNLKEHGEVDLIYLMDKNDIAIFQGSKCLYTSDGIDVGIIDEIISSVNLIHDKKINDIVNVLGFTFYREEFEKSFNIKAEDLKKANLFSPMDVNEIDKINLENQLRFDIDDILDKISAFGIASLSIEERLFLDNYSNEKRN